MNAFLSHAARRHSVRLASQFLALGIALAGSSKSLAQTDDFDDGNDTGWTRYNPFSGVAPNLARWEFTNGGYRIRTTAPSPSQQLGAGRAGSLRAEVYTNFYITVDIVNWDDTLPHAAGILARVQTPGLGTTTGYAFTWDRGNPASETAGDVDISKITGEAPSGVVISGADQIHLEPGKSYRFVFIGRDTELQGRVYELPDTDTPKVTIVGNDATYTTGVGGLVIYDNSTGATNICDITFDSFFAAIAEPPRRPRLQLKEIGGGFYELSWPKDASDFVLQSSPVLPATEMDWVDELDIISAPDRNYFVMDILFMPKQFFRLVRPE
jgi:hypothetical protein